jgi:hypothetical protein
MPIDPNTINIEVPKPNQASDSRLFRDNFNAIRNNFLSIADVISTQQITSLHMTGVVKAEQVIDLTSGVINIETRFQDTSSDVVLVIPGTGAVQLPVGNTSQRPVPAQGLIRYNTDSRVIEYHDNTRWRPLTGNAGGVTGPTGPSNGIVGPQGPMGPPGLPGQQGFPGVRGPTGPSNIAVTSELPQNVDTGSLWWNADDGNLYIRYDDTWVSAIAIEQGPTGPAGVSGTGDLIINNRSIVSPDPGNNLDIYTGDPDEYAEVWLFDGGIDKSQGTAMITADGEKHAWNFRSGGLMQLPLVSVEPDSNPNVMLEPGTICICDGMGWDLGGDGQQHICVYINGGWTIIA